MTRPSKLPQQDIDAFVSASPGWSVKAGLLTKSYRFQSYPDTLAYVVAVALAAERKDHHPDLSVSWGHVTVAWSTHDAGGLTALDLELAAQSDALAQRHGAHTSDS